MAVSNKTALMTFVVLTAIFILCSIFFYIDDINTTIKILIAHPVTLSTTDIDLPFNIYNASEQNITFEINGTYNIHVYGTSGLPMKNVQCSRLLAGDTQYIKQIPTHWRLDKGVHNPGVGDCERYKQKRGYITSVMTQEEEDFPIAFSILIYKDIPMFERLLRAVWRPHNVYCVHVDAKSSNETKANVSSIVDCFDNVFIQPKPVAVRWGTYTVLEPEILCMLELWKSKTKWKYFINLTGQEFPLKTNYQLFRILKAYKGANDVEGTFRGTPKFANRWQPAGPAPYKIKPVKAAVHIVVSRDFVDYVLHSNVSKALLKWVKPTIVPDETFFSSLNYNSHLKVPGSPVDDGKNHASLARYKLWEPTGQKCDGKYIRQICIFNVGDLLRLTSSPFMFANKFNYDYQPLAYDCLESWYHNKVREEKQGHVHFDVVKYAESWAVEHHF